MSRLPATFDRLRCEGRTGLIAYLTTGYPSLAETPALARALVDGGADIVELGIPFSDPLADGATVQRATFSAVEQGVTTGDVLAVVARLRAEGVAAPLVAMGYLNPILAYGIERFATDAEAAGLDGLIPRERIARVAADASGFIYCVSVTGTTGVRGDLPEDLASFIVRVREQTSLPLAVGFGVSRPEHVARIGTLCEAAVIGSAIIETIEQAPPEQRAERLRSYVEDVTGRRS